MTEQGIECSGNDDGGQHEGDGGQRTKQGFATEVKFREEKSSGESEGEGEEGGEGGLVKGEA